MMNLVAVPGMSCSARRFAGSSSAPPSGRFRRTRRRRARSVSSPSVYPRFSAGGYAGSAGRTHSSTIMLHSPSRAYLRQTSALPLIQCLLIPDLDPRGASLATTRMINLFVLFGRKTSPPVKGLNYRPRRRLRYSPRTNASSAALVSLGASCCTQCPIPGMMVEPRKSEQAIPGSA
jgi:hypothetical protein